MKKLLDRALSPQVFALAYLPWLAINMVSVINILDFTRVVLAVYAVWAVAVSVKTFFFSGKSAWTDKGMALLILFLAACLATQVLQFSYGGVDVLGRLCYFALCILVLYSQHGRVTEDYFTSLRWLVILLGVVIGALMLVSDWMFLEMYSATVTVRSGAVAYVGFAENRLFGVFTSPNVGGTFALILIWCSVLLFRFAGEMRGKVAWRVLAVVQILAAVMYISVALSRGTYVSGSVLVVSWMLFRMPSRWERSLARWKQAGLRVVSAAAALGVCVVMIGVANRVSCQLLEWNYERKAASAESGPSVSTPAAGFVAAIPVVRPMAAPAAQPVITDDEAQQIIDNAHLGFDGRVEAGDSDISNNRFEIWTSHLSLLHGKHYLIGINHPPTFMEKQTAAGVTFTEQQKKMVTYANGNMHNGYLQMLISGGLVVLLPMLAFLLWCAWRALRYSGGALLTGRFRPNSRPYALFSITFPMVLTILSNNLFETNFVLMGASFIQAFFWFIAGACVQSIREGEKQL